LEALFAGQLDDHLDELAHHYSRSDNIDKAVEYLGQAGQRAAQRSAYADAIRNLTAAINLLQALPDNPNRDRRELQLQLAAGPALLAAKGYAAPESELLYARAREPCERLGDSPELFPALHGLAMILLVRGELPKAFALGEQLLGLAQGTEDAGLLRYARLVLGVSAHLWGSCLPPGNISKWASPSTTLNAMFVMTLMPGSSA
jgi:predicted ATPase